MSGITPSATVIICASAPTELSVMDLKSLLCGGDSPAMCRATLPVRRSNAGEIATALPIWADLQCRSINAVHGTN
jgi:hypothetical protein